MLQSTFKDEYDLIFDNEHVAEVTREVEKMLPDHVQRVIKDASTALERLDKRFRVKRDASYGKAVLASALQGAVDQFKEEQRKYCEMFDRDSMQEYREDPNAFKTDLTKNCPIIQRSLRSSQEQMHKWQQDFKYTPARDLFDTFQNLVEFADEYVQNADARAYGHFDTWEAFGLSELDETGDLRLPGVIGTGIKSTVLYHLYPKFFARRGRFDLYGLYFLTNQQSFGLPSASSEFLMVDDKSTIRGERNKNMEHNFWYPYKLFSLHALRLYRMLSERFTTLGHKPDVAYRHVYVAFFLERVCRLPNNWEAVEIMLGGHQDEGTQFSRVA